MKSITIFILVLICLLYSNYIYSQNDTSITLYKNKFILHKVLKGEGLQSISRKYNIEVNDILKINNTNLTSLKINQVIKIPNINKPLNDEIDIVHANADEKDQNYALNFFHIVKKDENLLLISKLYNINVSEIIRINKMKDTIITEGQIINLNVYDYLSKKSYVPWNTTLVNIESASLLESPKNQIVEEYIDIVIDTVYCPVFSKNINSNSALILNHLCETSYLIENINYDSTLPSNTLKVNKDTYNKLILNPSFTYFTIKYIE
jgi:LysM repeat protein